MRRPLFSVIVPTYNRLAFLPECIQSVRAQTFRDFELIVVDDGSTDGSFEYLTSDVPEALVVQQSNAGAGAARNAGAHLASGEFLAFLDSDDLWFPWTLETYARVIGEYGDISLMVGGNTYIGQHECTDPKISLKVYWYKNLLTRMKDGMIPIPTPSVSIKRSVFLEIGGFREFPTGEDVDLWLRSGCSPGFVEIHAPLLSRQRLHQESLSRDVDEMAEGLFNLIRSEESGEYPGGREFRSARFERISMASRSIAFQSVMSGRIFLSFRIYFYSFYINIKKYRYRFIFGFPLFVAAHCLSAIKIFKVMR